MAKASDTNGSGDVSEKVRVRLAENGVAIPSAIDNALMRELTDDVLRGIGETGNAFEDAMQIAQQLYGQVKELSEDFGNGFQLLTDKSQLAGKKFLLLKWNFSSGEYAMFVTARVVTAEPINGGHKFIINDGSTGICSQLHDYSMREGKFGGYVATRGLRSSSYATCKACGKPRTSFDEICEGMLPNGTRCGDARSERGTGETFYLDLSS